MSWAPDYAEVADLLAFVRIGDSVDDDQAALAITSASRAIDSATGRQFGKLDAPQERFYRPDWDASRRRWVVQIDDLMVEPTAVESDGTATTGWVLRERNAVSKGRPWTELELASDAPHPGCDEVAVTAAWGWTAVPETVRQATLLQASRFLARRDSPLGVAGSPDMGGELRLLAKLDPDVETMLRGYRRTWWVA